MLGHVSKMNFHKKESLASITFLICKHDSRRTQAVFRAAVCVFFLSRAAVGEIVQPTFEPTRAVFFGLSQFVLSMKFSKEIEYMKWMVLGFELEFKIMPRNFWKFCFYANFICILEIFLRKYILTQRCTTRTWSLVFFLSCQ